MSGEKSITSSWTCPKPTAPGVGEADLARRVGQTAQRLAARPVPPERFAGFELEMALHILSGGGNVPEADNDFWRAKYQSLFLRPAIEPIAYGYWNRLAQLDFDDALALQIASALAGRKLVVRTGSIIGEARSGNVAFEDIVAARSWTADLKHAAGNPRMQPVLSAYVFARVIMAHPFSDGNGRFARLMVHAAMARSIGITKPATALAPTFYRNANTLGRAMSKLSRSGDWDAFYRIFFEVLEEAVVISARMCGH